MGQFRKCIEYNDLNVLIIEGNPTTQELAEAWANLFLEYCDLAEASETTYRIRLQCEILLLKRKNEICQSWIDIITVKPSERISEALRIVGYDFAFNPLDQKQYLADIDRVNAELRSVRFDLKIKEAEFAAIKKSPSVDDTLDVKYFSTIYTRINSYYKYNAVNDQTTVEMYCASLRDFVGAVEKNTEK